MTTHNRDVAPLDVLGPPRAGVPRGLVLLLGAASVVIVTAGVQAVAWLVGPILMALVIVICVAPVQWRLRRWGVPDWVSSVVMVVLVYAILLGLALGIVVSLARLAGLLPQYTTQSGQFARALTGFLARFGVEPGQIRNLAGSLDVGKLAPLIERLLRSVASLATNLVFLLGVLFFLAIETRLAEHRLTAIGADHPMIRDALSRFAGATRRYMLVTTVFGLLAAALDTVALLVIGIPLPLTWGILAFVTNFIPSVGFVIGLAPPAVLGLLIGGPKGFVLVIVVYLAVNFVASTIESRFVGNAIGLSSVVTFVGLVFWTWLFGPLGAILAVPATLLVKALLVDVDPDARWAHDLLHRARPPKRASARGPSGATG